MRFLKNMLFIVILALATLASPTQTYQKELLTPVVVEQSGLVIQKMLGEKQASTCYTWITIYIAPSKPLFVMRALEHTNDITSYHGITAKKGKNPVLLTLLKKLQAATGKNDQITLFPNCVTILHQSTEPLPLKSTVAANALATLSEFLKTSFDSEYWETSVTTQVGKTDRIDSEEVKLGLPTYEFDASENRKTLVLKPSGDVAPYEIDAAMKVPGVMGIKNSDGLLIVNLNPTLTDAERSAAKSQILKRIGL